MSQLDSLTAPGQPPPRPWTAGPPGWDFDGAENLRIFRNALEKHAIVAITDPRGRIQHVSDLFCQISGYSRAELIGQTHRVVNSGIHPPAFWTDMWQTIVHRETWTGQICNRAKNGELYWVQSAITPLLDDRGRFLGYLAVRTDITELKQAKAALMAETARLEEARLGAEAAARAKADFAATISHEIRTPMNGVLGMLTLLLDTPLSPAQRDQAKTARDCARGLLALLNDVLDFSKLEAEKAEAEALPCSPARIAEEVVALLADQARAKGLTLDIQVDPEVPKTIVSDPSRLRQVLFNLVGNALKFTAEGGVRLRIGRPGGGTGEPRLRFEITDSGCGIESEAQGRLFTRFTQADSSITRIHGGTGLGLAISKKLVELLGGEIGVASAAGAGATFWFTVDYQPAAAPEARATAPNLLEPAPPGLRILVAEDNAVNQRVVEAMLTSFGYIVDIAGNGEEAVGMFRRGLTYDLVLMDIHMPVMDGLAASREINRLLGPDAPPIIALTANVFSEQRASYAASGMVDTVGKPIDLDDLIGAIARAAAPPDRYARSGPAAPRTKKAAPHGRGPSRSVAI